MNTSLKELSLVNCNLRDSELLLLQEALSSNSSLNVLNLSHNKLSRQSGNILGGVLKAHSKRRDDIVWTYSLRGEEIEEDITA